MFEQALLSTGPRPDKRRAMAAALTGQVVAVSALVIVSMFYADKLTPPHLVHLVAPPLLRDQPVVEQQPTRASAAQSIAPAPANRTVFHVPTTPLGRVVADAGSPDLTPVTSLGGNIGSGIPNALNGPDLTVSALAAPPPSSPTPVLKRPSGPIRIGGEVAQAMLIHKVLPVYPALAKHLRLSGVVQLTGVIGKDGTIQRLEVSSGHPLLVGAALEAVKQWVYRPTLLNGEPVEVLAPIQVRFVLSN